ncbi:hypothetical protein [Thalassotalea crassostreae]|uniref:hypothetical protein n=1 Tax=Thalassotalea crassostreae TaxID=1763536 RepID=UPI000837D2D8|nr:hypothetical protein [Thalassotalea crassostreae]
MNKTLILIHGRATKPEEQDLKALWLDAIRHGIKRDHGQETLDIFNQLTIDFVYYGDLSNQFLKQHDDSLTIPDDIESRQDALNQLKNYSPKQFNKTTYNKINKTNHFKEALADTFSGILAALGAGDNLIGAVAPDMKHYWYNDSYFGSDVRYRLTKVLTKRLSQDKNIMLVAHSLGSIIAYDNLWKLSHYSEYRNSGIKHKKIDTLITLGSPLSDENVKQHLKGSANSGKYKYPNNIKHWVNIAAEDDYISHDSQLKNDYQEMLHLNLIENIKDITPVYNLTVRNQRSNPHSSIGYLIHPKFIQQLVHWFTP